MNMRTLILLGLLYSGVGSAAPSPTLLKWDAKLAESTTLLKAGDYRRALKIATALTDDMLENLGPGDSATRLFGIVLTHRSLALVGLGREEEGLWYWHTVLSLYPAFSRSDLTDFGRAGQFLTDHPIPPEPTPAGPDTAIQVSPPRELSRVRPQFPEGAQQFRVTGTLVVRVLITETGAITSPQVITPLPAPTLTYAALEAVRRWRYAPGTADGKPVAVPLTVSVTFRLE